MARRFRHRYRAPSGPSRFAFLRLDRTLMARTSVRSALDACPNAAQRFPTRPALCSVPRESFWFDNLTRPIRVELSVLAEYYFAVTGVSWLATNCQLFVPF